MSAFWAWLKYLQRILLFSANSSSRSGLQGTRQKKKKGCMRQRNAKIQDCKNAKKERQRNSKRKYKYKKNIVFKTRHLRIQKSLFNNYKMFNMQVHFKNNDYFL